MRREQPGFAGCVRSGVSWNLRHVRPPSGTLFWWKKFWYVLEVAGVLKNLASDRSKLAGLGEAGRNFVQQFERERVLTDFAVELEKPA